MYMPNRYKKQIIGLLTFLCRKLVKFVSEGGRNKSRDQLSSVSKFRSRHVEKAES